MNIVQSVWSAVLSVPLPTMLLAVLTLFIFTFAVFTVAVIQFGTRLRHLATPLFDRTVKEAQEKAERILVDAREQGSAMRAHAQTEAEKIFTDRKEEDEKFRIEQTVHLKEITSHTKDLLIKQIHIAEKTLQDEAENIRQTFVREDESLKQILTDIGAQTEREYQVLMEEIKKRTLNELTKEIELARKAISVYKQERFEILNKEIIRLVEDTARIALHKSLSLDDHRGIILDALAKAKREGVFDTLS